MPVPAVFLGLGSNLGDREAALQGAQALLAARGFRTLARSSLYLTEPFGGPPPDWFLNALPHPRLHERLFVLGPLAELAPGVRHPVLGLTAEEMRRPCQDTHVVRLQAPNR